MQRMDQKYIKPASDLIKKFTNRIATQLPKKLRKEDHEALQQGILAKFKKGRVIGKGADKSEKKDESTSEEIDFQFIAFHFEYCFDKEYGRKKSKQINVKETIEQKIAHFKKRDEDFVSVLNLALLVNQHTSIDLEKIKPFIEEGRKAIAAVTAVSHIKSNTPVPTLPPFQEDMSLAVRQIGLFSNKELVSDNDFLRICEEVKAEDQEIASSNNAEPGVMFLDSGKTQETDSDWTMQSNSNKQQESKEDSLETHSDSSSINAEPELSISAEVPLRTEMDAAKETKIDTANNNLDEEPNPKEADPKERIKNFIAGGIAGKDKDEKQRIKALLNKDVFNNIVVNLEADLLQKINNVIKVNAKDCVETENLIDFGLLLKNQLKSKSNKENKHLMYLLTLLRAVLSKMNANAGKKQYKLVKFRSADASAQYFCVAFNYAGNNEDLQNIIKNHLPGYEREECFSVIFKFIADALGQSHVEKTLQEKFKKFIPNIPDTAPDNYMGCFLMIKMEIDADYAFVARDIESCISSHRPGSSNNPKYVIENCLFELILAAAYLDNRSSGAVENHVKNAIYCLQNGENSSNSDYKELIDMINGLGFPVPEVKHAEANPFTFFSGSSDRAANENGNSSTQLNMDMQLNPEAGFNGNSSEQQLNPEAGSKRKASDQIDIQRGLKRPKTGS